MLHLLLCQEEQRKKWNKEKDRGSSNCVQICHKAAKNRSVCQSLHSRFTRETYSLRCRLFLFPGQDKMPHGQPLTTKTSEFLKFIFLLSCFLEILKRRHFLCYTMHRQTLNFSFPRTKSPSWERRQE